MALINNLRVQVDQPVWEWCRFFPAANSALSEFTSVETPGNRYFYMLVTGTMYRYDTYTDMWQTLATAVTTPLLILSMKYVPYGGYAGKAITATSSTLTGAFLQGKTFIGNKIRIIAGTGIGQETVITANADAVIADSGIPTTATASVITDTTKKWDINQWAGYTCKIVDFNGQTQFRKILYNSATALTVSDTNHQQYAQTDNMPFATAPTTASIYTIESNVLTVSPTWTITPDSSSIYEVLSGMVEVLSTMATAPFQTLQFYDIAADIWITKSCQQGILLGAGAAANDISYHPISEAEAGATGSYDSGTATASGSAARALGDTTKSWVVDQWANYELKITAGTGAGSRRRILGNVSNILYTDGALINTPDTTSTYVIRPMRNMRFMSGMAIAGLYGYDLDSDQWTQGFKSDAGLCNALSVRLSNWYPIACTATRAVTGITAITTTPSTPGTNYLVGDLLGDSTTGSGAQFIVVSTDNAGGVTSLKIQKCGANYGTTAVGVSATGGSGSGCKFDITAVGTVGTVTTAINHNFSAGQTVTFAGATEAAWNGAYTIVGTSSLTTFDFVTTATLTTVATQAQTTGLIVDASKNWVSNEHAGKVVILSTVGTSGTTQVRRITSNTATVLTLYGSAITAGIEGTSRYIIHDPDEFGRAVQDKNPTRTNTGWATSGTANNLVDSSKAWKGNQWVGYKVRIVCGTGYNVAEATITSNNATTLMVSGGGWGFTPDTTTKYVIEDTFGIPTTITNTTNAVVTDTTKNWVVNQWSGFRISISAGEGTAQEAAITSNTATALTISGVFTTAPVANSSYYTILGVPVRGTGHELTWISNSTTNAGKYIISPRGGSNAFDRFNISTNTWDLTFAPKPDADTYNLGTMYAYDGKDRLFIQKDALGLVRYIDMTTYQIHGGGTMPYIVGSSGIGTAVNGNRMEIIQTADGLKYLYIMKHTGAALSATGGGTEMFRVLILW